MEVSNQELHLLSKRLIHMMAYGTPSERDVHVAVRKRLIDILIEEEDAESNKFVKELMEKTQLPVQELGKAAAEDLFKLTKHIQTYVKDLETTEYSTEDQAFIDQILDELKRYCREVNGNDLFIQ